VSGGVIAILPKLPATDDEYTSEQRRMIDARLAEGLADIQAGRTFGPFDNADEMIAHMKARLKNRAAVKVKRSSMKVDYSGLADKSLQSLPAGVRRSRIRLALLFPHPGRNLLHRGHRPASEIALPFSASSKKCDRAAVESIERATVSLGGAR
jgi:hypothetical protein